MNKFSELEVEHLLEIARRNVEEAEKASFEATRTALRADQKVATMWHFLVAASVATLPITMLFLTKLHEVHVILCLATILATFIFETRRSQAWFKAQASLNSFDEAVERHVEAKMKYRENKEAQSLDFVN